VESPVAEVGWICTRLPRATKGKGESEKAHCLSGAARFIADG